MDKPFGVLLVHDSIKCVLMCDNVSKPVISGSGNSDGALLGSAFKPNDDVFL
jgi:hypothetical protein